MTLAIRCSTKCASICIYAGCFGNGELSSKDSVEWNNLLADLSFVFFSSGFNSEFGVVISRSNGITWGVELSDWTR